METGGGGYRHDWRRWLSWRRLWFWLIMRWRQCRGQRGSMYPHAARRPEAQEDRHRRYQDTLAPMRGEGMTPFETEVLQTLGVITMTLGDFHTAQQYLLAAPTRMESNLMHICDELDLETDAVP